MLNDQHGNTNARFRKPQRPKQVPCEGLGDHWFSEHAQLVSLTRRICREKCPVREQCFRLALENREPCGVWGGSLFRNGKAVPVSRIAGPRQAAARLLWEALDKPGQGTA